ncbi:D-glycero-beta-D-manno-heptose-7-phosphate kinase [bacterium]
MQKSKLLKIVDKFPNTNILVIGDIMLDKFIWGKVKRISPEAPVPVVEITKETHMPGGAGNVVSNISELGGTCYIVGIIGNDETGKTFLSDMNGHTIKTEGILKVSERPTIIKTRIIADHQQVVRVDKEVNMPIHSSHTDKLINSIKNILPSVSLVVISDYGKGVISKKLLNALVRNAKRLKKPILVDPKIEHFKNYKKVTCITPNLNEALQGMHHLKADTQKDVEKLGDQIMKKLELESLIITQGEKGMTIFEKKNKTHIPTLAKEVFDVTGAGDTVISTLALSLANKANILESAYIANCAAGIVVGKLGTACITREEIKDKLNSI